MIHITEWKNLRKYGIDYLTGEACALHYRGLVDFTAEGLEIFKKAFSLLGVKTSITLDIETASNWNSTILAVPSVASLLVPFAFFEPLAVFALLLREECPQVVIGPNHHVVGLETTDSEEEFNRFVLVAFGQKHRLIKNPVQRKGITVGFANVHQMTGDVMP